MYVCMSCLPYSQQLAKLEISNAILKIIFILALSTQAQNREKYDRLLLINYRHNIDY
jgi:hypothetical protein